MGSIKELYPRSHITWICGRRSFSLIRHISVIDRPLPFTYETMAILDHERYNLCINFDLAVEATALAARAQAEMYKGFGRQRDGAAIALNPEAETWLEMSLWDDKKKANRLTYQAHMRRILGAPEVNHPILATRLPEKQEKARLFAYAHGLDRSRPLIGFNVGAGDRWQHKKWTVEGFVRLGELLREELDGRIMILYGPADAARAREVMAAMTVPFVDAGLRASVLDFFPVLDLCDVVVTGDTLALHAALGLGKKVVCLVGPTSAAELELYGQGIILMGDIDCLGCYRTRCDKDPLCMKLLSPNAVYSAVKELIEKNHDPLSP
ncbi:MAG: glycosyltransferase family 9 protein [Candidatus Omnitrophota bacterium]